MLIILPETDVARCINCGARAKLSVVNELDSIDYCKECFLKEMDRITSHLVPPTPED